MSVEPADPRKQAKHAQIKSPTRQTHLIVQTAFLGDVLLGIPFFKALRQDYPTHSLVLLCRKGVGSFFKDTGLVDDVIEVDKKDKTSWAIAKERTRSEYFDLIFCPHESFRSARFVASLKANQKIGFKRFFNLFIFDKRVRRPLEAPEALRQLALLGSVNPKWNSLRDSFVYSQSGLGGQSKDGLVPVPEEASMTVPEIVQIRRARETGDKMAAVLESLPAVLEPLANVQEPIVVLAPGSVWRTKQWTKEGFIQAGQKFAKDDGALIVIMGSKDEKSLCDEIAGAIPNSLSLAGRTSLIESAKLLALADLLICNDSGAMHLGATADVPMISVFGPTVLEFGYRPWSNRARVVQVPLACRPCGKHGAQKCPIGTHACMRDVSSTMVLSAAQSLRVFAPSRR